MMATPQTCTDCEVGNAVANLICGVHSVCNDCLVQRTKDQPREVLRCKECGPYPPSVKKVTTSVNLFTPSCLFADAVRKPTVHVPPDINEEPSLLKVKSPDPTLPGIYIFSWMIPTSGLQQKYYRVG